MKIGMLQRSGVLDQPLVGRGGVHPQTSSLCDGFSCQVLRFPPWAFETWLEVCGSSQSPSAGSWFGFGVFCWAQGRPFWVSLGQKCFPFYRGPWVTHGRAGDQLCGKEGKRV
jgi:hypothetical protein